MKVRKLYLGFLNFDLHPVLIIIINWFFQGFRYMDKYEKSLKLLLEFLLICLIYFPFSLFLNPNFFIVIIISHSINWVINGQIFTLARYVYPFPKTELDFEKFIHLIKLYRKNFRKIKEILIYGSYCRNDLNKNSDLDVRIIVEDKFVDGYEGAIFCLIMRAIALIKMFPLDIYSISNKKLLNRLSQNEIPIKII